MGGSRACQFAADSACLPIYDRVFGGGRASGTTLQTTMNSVWLIVCVRCAYRVLKAALYACQDFVYMASVSIWCFVFISIPAIVTMHYFFESTLAAVLVMALPNFVALLLFGWRLCLNLSMMRRGDQGPWTRPQPPASVGSFMTLAASVPGMPTPGVTPPLVSSIPTA